MIFLFGTRSGNTQYFKIDNKSCPYCASENTLFGETRSNYFHFFFFPMVSLGKSTVLTCSHCQKKFEEKQSTPPIQEELALRESVQPKSPAWHSCGCIIILLVALFFAVSTCANFVFKDSNKTIEEEANDPFEKMYRDDLKKLTSTPEAGGDSVAVYVKNYIDAMVSDEMGKSKFQYFSRTKENRLLVIMKVPDMKKVATEERSGFLTLINDALNRMKFAQDKQLYIAVEGYWNTVLVYTPTFTDAGGRFADTERIYDFYKPSLIKSDTIKGKTYDAEVTDTIR